MVSTNLGTAHTLSHRGPRIVEKRRVCGMLVGVYGLKYFFIQLRFPAIHAFVPLEVYTVASSLTTSLNPKSFARAEYSMSPYTCGNQ